MFCTACSTKHEYSTKHLSELHVAQNMNTVQNLLQSSIDFNGGCFVLHAVQNMFAVQNINRSSPLI